MSAKRSVIIHQTSAFVILFVLKFNFITQQFLLVGVQGLFFSPGAGYPRYATDITLLVFENCAII